MNLFEPDMFTGIPPIVSILEKLALVYLFSAPILIMIGFYLEDNDPWKIPLFIIGGIPLGLFVLFLIWGSFYFSK